MGCGLIWNVPPDWQFFDRQDKIRKIKEALRVEMDARAVSTDSIDWFLDSLASRTNAITKHVFVTSNWDYLLQRRVDLRDSKYVPLWLRDSKVYHVNGTVEDIPANENFFSSFMLPEDRYSERENKIESNLAFDAMIWGTIFVVVGMSFECETDRFLIHGLGQVRDKLPVGESTWIIVNPDEQARNKAGRLIITSLPLAKVIPVCASLEQWRKQGFPELAAYGVFTS